MPGTHPQYFGWGDVNGNITRNIITYFRIIADRYWLPSVRSASSRFHSAIRRHQFASVRQADSRLTRLVPPTFNSRRRRCKSGPCRAREHTRPGPARSRRLRDRVATSPSVDCAGGRPLWTKQWLGWAHATRLASPTHTHTQFCVERRRAANTERGDGRRCRENYGAFTPDELNEKRLQRKCCRSLQWRHQDFVTGGSEVWGGLEYKVPQKLTHLLQCIGN